MEEEDSASHLKILISTDNHLGVWEKDELRKDDSFIAFEEVLQKAKEHKVDMLLLGGDLFHDNKPSRPTVVRTVRLLMKYCLGDEPIQFRVVSDAAENFVGGRANFQDPNINVGLPVFTIHGNHDDPAGTDNLSAVDLVSAAGLVNYFGKVALAGSNIGRITLKPVLLEKGGTKLALYGLGNVRDERLARLFQTPGCVQWVRPSPTPQYAVEDWVNVFVLHQNRVQHGASSKNCIQDRHLPPFLDLVVWGHEHECKADPELISTGDDGRVSKQRARDRRETSVVQPGSTVATALSEGESKKKHVVLLEVLGSHYRTSKLALDTVRPFIWESVALRDAQGVDPEDQQALATYLERQVTKMIAETRNSSARGAAAVAEVSGAAPGAPLPPLLPLVRLRVDYTGFSTINSQRFGQKFVNKVANPNDILLWSKAAQRRAKEAGGSAAGEAAAMGLRPEAQDQARIEDLVTQNLPENMKVIIPDDLALALHDYVDKDEKGALAACIETALEATRSHILKDEPTAPAGAAGPRKGGKGDDEEEAIAEAVRRAVQKRLAERLTTAPPPTAPAAGAAAAGGGVGGGAGTGAAAGRQRASEDDDMMEDLDAAPLADDGTAAPAAAAAPKPRNKAAAAAAAAPGMPPPRGRAAKGAASTAAGAASSGGGMRQAGILETLNRANAKQRTTPTKGAKGPLDAYLVTSPTGTQASSRSRTAAGRAGATAATTAAGGAAAAAARGGAGGAKKAVGRGGGGARGGGEEEIISSSSDEGERPAAKRARGAAPAPSSSARTASTRPARRAAAARAPGSYATGGGGDDEEDLESIEISDEEMAEGISDPSSDDTSLDSEGDATPATRGRGGGGARGKRGGGGAARGGAAAARGKRGGGAAGGRAAAAAEESEEMIESDDEDFAAAAPTPRGGGRRLPASLGVSTQNTTQNTTQPTQRNRAAR